MKRDADTARPDWTLALAREAALRVPAYAAFLHERGAHPTSFDALPVMTKENYIQAYPLEGRIARDEHPPYLHASSGSSGVPTYWLRSGQQEAEGAVAHERIFEMLGIAPEAPTLAIVCFSMGIWVAGSFTASSLRGMHERGWHVTVATPSLEREDILALLKEFVPARPDGTRPYEHVVLFGYPPFLTDVLGEARRRKILPDAAGRVSVVSAGAAISEGWRERTLDQIGATRPTQALNIYGSADAAVMGIETEETIWLRRMASALPDLRDELAGVADRFSLFTYDPGRIFFEEQDGELLITLRAAVPLIRYNIHDRGRVLSRFPMMGRRTALPLVAVTGRTDVAVTFYAINIYPEHIAAALEGGKAGTLATGSFRVYTREVGRAHRETLHLDIECASSARPKAAAERAISEAIVRTLSTHSIEYRNLHETLGGNALPVISLVPNGALELKKRGRQTFVFIKGKKPKMAA